MQLYRPMYISPTRVLSSACQHGSSPISKHSQQHPEGIWGGGLTEGNHLPPARGSNPARYKETAF